SEGDPEKAAKDKAWISAQRYKIELAKQEIANGADPAKTVNKALEAKRAEKVIGKSLEAKVILTVADEETAARLGSYSELKDVFIVSAVEVAAGAVTSESGMDVTIEKAPGEKCERCWCYSEEVGKITLHPTLCKRCASVIG
ncbi:MAG: hypothetical protein IJ595_04930, partial [Oscillospiraceae bacterium]|nr:hypothetical protein [Oscillospiraceae bacterium]